MKKIQFTTPSIFDKSIDFGCASFGFAGSPDPASADSRTYETDIPCSIFSGNLKDVLAEIPCSDEGKSWKAGIVLFGNCGGENEFIHELTRKTGCLFTGGAAACDPVTGASGLISSGEIPAQVTVCLFSDDDHKFSVITKNVHTNILGEHKIGFTNPRILDSIDGEDALTWYNNLRSSLGFPETDFEHVTFSDLNNVNCHMSISEGRLVSGRDLCETMRLRYVKKGDVYPQMSEFYKSEGKATELVFGCAGLKGILEQDIMEGDYGMFMFGEVAGNEFGNLMISKIVVE